MVLIGMAMVAAEVAVMQFEESQMSVLAVVGGPLKQNEEEVGEEVGKTAAKSWGSGDSGGP